jgi:hypothetical protein
MTRLHAHVVINAPAAAAWTVVAHQFDRVGEWATAIPVSAATPGPAAAGAPVAGRVCRTGIRMIPEVVERIVVYDETARTLTYQAEGLPAFLGTARNQWRVEAVDDQHTRVRLEATLQVRGVLGWLAYLVLRVQLARTGRRFLQDLKHYVEHREPSPRKRRQLPGTYW